MIEHIRTNEVIEKKNHLIKLSSELKEIVNKYSDSLKIIEGDNNIYSSPSSNYYLDNLYREINKINEFIIALDDLIKFLEQVSNNYIEVDKEIINKLNEIGDVV